VLNLLLKTSEPFWILLTKKVAETVVVETTKAGVDVFKRELLAQLEIKRQNLVQTEEKQSRPTKEKSYDQKCEKAQPILKNR
jgi:hypothetical protein